MMPVQYDRSRACGRPASLLLNGSASAAPEIAVIGGGSVAWAYFDAIDRLVSRGLASLGAICVRRRDAWPAVLRARPRASLVASVDELLASAADIVVVATPPDSHAALATAAVEAGKHVVVEKPLAMDADDARSVFAAARRAGRYVVAAPFTQLSPSFRALWTHVQRGDIGRPHSARALYGNLGSDWAAWYHRGGVGPLAEVGIYNVKSVTALLGPVVRVIAAVTTGIAPRTVGGDTFDPDPDSAHVVLQHASGALTSIVASQAMWTYRRTAIEVYGSEGTANLLGDDWDPVGYEIWRVSARRWEQYESPDRTWHWADGVAELVHALREERPPLVDADHDLHVLEIIDAARRAAGSTAASPVESTFADLALAVDVDSPGRHLHDHTRPADRQ
jgi:predicted dehydrogenase